MQAQQSSRIDLAELKSRIAKKVGAERFKKYFYYLNRFLSQKLNKSDFDKHCFRLLGRENLALHNQLICSVLKNACQAKKAPPPAAGPTQSVPPQLSKSSPAGEDGYLLPNQNASIWSNGVLPMSPRKVRSGMRDRKPRDRPSPLGPTGKVDPCTHQLVTTGNGETMMATPCDYERPMQQHLQAVAEPSDKERSKYTSFSGDPLLAPLGIPFCSASVGGSRKAQPAATTSSSSFYDGSGLCDSETLRKRMERIAALQGIGGVSMECANTLNNMLDDYLKRLIKSCVDLVGARKPHIHKQEVQGRAINGVWPTNHLHMQTKGGTSEVMHEQRPRCSISLLDFKVAMQLNPQQLGEDWPLMLEKICMLDFDN